MLENEKKFAILFPDENLLATVEKISLRKSVHYNKVKFKNGEIGYVLYNPEKVYLFDMARNKKLKLIWKDETDFYIIDFHNNTKGDIICNLSNEHNGNDIIEGDVVTINFEESLRNIKKVMLISSKQLDKKQPYNYEHFCFEKNLKLK